MVRETQLLKLLLRLPVEPRMKLPCFAILLGLLLLTVPSVEAQPVRDSQVEVELVASHLKVAPGQEIWLAIRIKPDDGWHTYWKNPGDTGLATAVKWTLPPGFEAAPLAWPYPDRYQSDGLVSFVYEREEMILTSLKVPSSAQPGEVKLSAQVDWLACKDTCVPGSADLSLLIEVAAEASESPQAQAVEQARSRLPGGSPDEALEATWDSQNIILQARWSSDQFQKVEDVLFVSDQDLVIENGALQLFRASPRELQVRLLTASVKPTKPGQLSGVLVVKSTEGIRSFRVDVPVKEAEEKE